MQSKQLTTTSPKQVIAPFELIPKDIAQLILIEAVLSNSDIKEKISLVMKIVLVSHLFLKITLAISHGFGYCPKGQEMDSAFLDILDIAYQELSPQTPFLRPIKIMPKYSWESPDDKLPVYHTLLIKDPRQFGSCDGSQVERLLFSLPDQQYEKECSDGISYTLNFFRKNKFPKLKSLVLTKVNFQYEVLKYCSENLNLEHLHLKYCSLDDMSAPGSTSAQCCVHLDLFNSLQKLEITTSMTFQKYPDVIACLPHNLRKCALNIVMGVEDPTHYYAHHNMKFDASKSKSLSIVEMHCDPSFSGRLEFCPPEISCVKGFTCDAYPNQVKFDTVKNPNWGHGVDTAYLHKDFPHGTLFPNCHFIKYYDSQKTTNEDVGDVNSYEDVGDVNFYEDVGDVNFYEDVGDVNSYEEASDEASDEAI